MITDGFLNIGELPDVVCLPKMQLPPLEESCYVNIVEMGQDHKEQMN